MHNHITHEESYKNIRDHINLLKSTKLIGIRQATWGMGPLEPVICPTERPTVRQNGTRSEDLHPVASNMVIDPWMNCHVAKWD